MKSLIFHTIYRQHTNLVPLAAKSDFFARHCTRTRRFRAAMSSLELQTRVRCPLLRTLQDQLRNVPALVMDGRYRVTADMAGAYRRMFRIAAWLAQRLAKTG